MSFWEEQANGTFKKIKDSLSKKSKSPISPKKNNLYNNISKNNLRNQLNKIDKSNKNLIIYILIFIVIAILIGLGYLFKDKIRSLITGKKEDNDMN